MLAGRTPATGDGDGKPAGGGDGDEDLHQGAPEWRQAVDDHYASLADTLETMDPDERARFEDDYAQATGVLPDAIAKTLRGGLLSADPAEQAAAAQRLARLQDVDPGLVSAIPAQERRRAAAIAEFADLGLPAPSAVELAEEKRADEKPAEGAPAPQDITGGADDDGTGDDTSLAGDDEDVTDPGEEDTPSDDEVVEADERVDKTSEDEEGAVDSEIALTPQQQAQILDDLDAADDDTQLAAISAGRLVFDLLSDLNQIERQRKTGEKPSRDAINRLGEEILQTLGPEFALQMPAVQAYFALLMARQIAEDEELARQFEEKAGPVIDILMALPQVRALGVAFKASREFKRAVTVLRRRLTSRAGKPGKIKSPARPKGSTAARHFDNSERRFRQFKPRGTNQPPGTFDQTALQAFLDAGFPPKTLSAKVRRGLAAVDLLIEKVRAREPSAVIKNAMHRDDVPFPIHIPWGEPGSPDNEYRGGYGLSHIAAKHGIEAIEGVIEAIAQGTATDARGSGGKRKVIEHDGFFAIIELIKGKKGQEPAWVLTGYETDPNTDKPFDLGGIDGALFFKGKGAPR